MPFLPVNDSINTVYRDLDLDFFKNPNSNDVSIKTGAEAIKRSVRNIMLSNFYERPFRPTIGSDVPRMLFEPGDMFTRLGLEEKIKDVVETYEPRVRVLQVVVDEELDQNGFRVTLNYEIKLMRVQATASYFLERIR